MPSKKWNKKKSPPPGFEVIEPVLEALENELRDKVKESNAQKRKTESLWPVHQLNWQRSRYVYDMYYTYHRISKSVYDYCISQKLVDAALIAKWKKPGYERLCSTYVINPTNYKFGTTSICRVPWKDRSDEQKNAKDPTTGCMGCASGKGQPRNIFGNKYGQNLAAVQVAREQRMQQLEQKKQQEAAVQREQHDNDDDEGEEETDEEETDEEDYGPSPAAGVWAGSQKLQAESEALAEEEEAEQERNEEEGPPSKKVRTD